MATPVPILYGVFNLIVDFVWRYSGPFQKTLRKNEEEANFDVKVKEYNLLMLEHDFLEARLEMLNDN